MDNEKQIPTEEQQTETTEVSELETLKAEKDELYDKYLRTLAEYDNFRKRSQREKEAIYGDATAEAVKKLLPVLDSFERALNYECKDEEFKKGISLIQNTLKEIFDNMGVKEIPDMGEQFDPNLHEAVMHIDNPELPENVITDVYRKGYMLGDKVIRHTMVIVAN
ncbi:MAG: nucleotide exchange factor GrpE [Oscillospiraceae bacterium]|nr:nucleotide exchange factor GrpE [Oscillospiraceae bacterium]